jgi:hypothetical protein
VKLFMRAYTDTQLGVIKPPAEYTAVCMSCAGKLGGKINGWAHAAWQHAECGACGHVKEVTKPKEFTWR